MTATTADASACAALAAHAWLVGLAEGSVESGAARVGRALADESLDPVARVGPLAAQVELAIVAGDLDTASAVADELAGIADPGRGVGAPWR